MLKFAVFVLMNGLVFGGAALVARYGLRLRDRLAIGFAAILVGWVYVVVGLEVLGLFGQIRLVPALMLAACGFSVGIGCWLCCRNRVGCVERTDSTSVGVLHAPDGTNGGLVQRIVRLSLWLALTLAVWASVDMLVTGVCGPVHPVSDAPIYHLYFAVRWWQSGTLEIVPTPFGESAAPYFPANGDVWFTWLVLPWSSELVAKVGQWPFLIVGMAAVYALARELNVRPGIAAFPAALWGTGSLPLVNSSFADVDLIMAAWYLTAVWFLVRYRREARAVDLVCAALAMGAVLGTKYVAIPFLVWIMLAATILVWRSPRRWRHFGILMGGVLMPAVYWFARNIWLTGNPLYPLHVALVGRVILSGWYTRATMLTNEHYHIPIFPLWQQLRVLIQMLLRGFDPVLLPVWLAGIVAACWAAMRGRRLGAALVLLGVAHVLCFWFVNPYQREERFLLSAFGLLAVPIALVLERWKLLRVPVAALLTCHLVVDQANLRVSRYPPAVPAPMRLAGLRELDFQGHPIMAGRLGLLAAVCGAVALGMQRPGNWTRRGTIAAVALVVLASGVGYRAAKSRPPLVGPKWQFYPLWLEGGFLPGWHRLEDASGRGVRVAYAGTNLPFYLFGLGLRNQVRYVNINDRAGFRMHDYHAFYSSRGEPRSATPTPDWDRREADEEAWLKNLRDEQVDLLFLGLTNRAGGLHNFYDSDGFTIERTWADRHPDIFSPLHIDRFTRLYAVRFR